MCCKIISVATTYVVISQSSKSQQKQKKKSIVSDVFVSSICHRNGKQHCENEPMDNAKYVIILSHLSRASVLLDITIVEQIILYRLNAYWGHDLLYIKWHERIVASQKIDFVHYICMYVISSTKSNHSHFMFSHRLCAIKIKMNMCTCTRCNCLEIKEEFAI